MSTHSIAEGRVKKSSESISQLSAQLRTVSDMRCIGMRSAYTWSVASPNS